PGIGGAASDVGTADRGRAPPGAAAALRARPQALRRGARAAARAARRAPWRTAAGARAGAGPGRQAGARAGAGGERLALQPVALRRARAVRLFARARARHRPG